MKVTLPTLGYDFDPKDIRDANGVALLKPGKGSGLHWTQWRATVGLPC